MGKHEVTILSAVDELQRMFKGLNALFFDNELEKVIITIQTDVTKGAYAWISTAPVWSDKDNRSYREINIVAEYLNREPALVISSLLHEMCHLYNLHRGFKIPAALAATITASFAMLLFHMALSAHSPLIMAGLIPRQRNSLSSGYKIIVAKDVFVTSGSLCIKMAFQKRRRPEQMADRLQPAAASKAAENMFALCVGYLFGLPEIWLTN